MFSTVSHLKLYWQFSITLFGFISRGSMLKYLINFADMLGLLHFSIQFCCMSWYLPVSTECRLWATWGNYFSIFWLKDLSILFPDNIFGFAAMVPRNLLRKQSTSLMHCDLRPCLFLLVFSSQRWTTGSKLWIKLSYIVHITKMMLFLLVTNFSWWM